MEILDLLPFTDLTLLMKKYFFVSSFELSYLSVQPKVTEGIQQDHFLFHAMLSFLFIFFYHTNRYIHGFRFRLRVGSESLESRLSFSSISLRQLPYKVSCNRYQVPFYLRQIKLARRKHSKSPQYFVIYYRIQTSLFREN